MRTRYATPGAPLMANVGMGARLRQQRAVQGGSAVSVPPAG